MPVQEAIGRGWRGMTRKDNTDRAALLEAARWSARLADEDATEADWRAFEAWLSSPSNREAYDIVEHRLGEIEDNRGSLRRSLAPGSGRAARQKAKGRQPLWVWGGGLAGVAAAFTVAIIVATSGSVSEHSPQAGETTAYVAPTDQTRVVTLADGSSATLNRGASLRVQMTKDLRNVSLVSGEASFKVAHEAGRPFSVTAGAVRILDLGTEFNVMHADDVVIVTVRSGVVRTELPGPGGNHVDLRAGEQVRFVAKDSLATVSRVNPDDAFAWTSGRLVFHNANLREIVAQMNRYGEKPIDLPNGALSDLRFSGVLVIGTSENMVSQLAALLPLRPDESKEAISLRAR